MICKINKNDQNIIKEVLIDGRSVDAGERLIAISEIRNKR
jgi:hypothetical protein